MTMISRHAHFEPINENNDVDTVPDGVRLVRCHATTPCSHQYVECQLSAEIVL